jgi:DNA-directed RNA polymerase specialized sigma24 family protein
MSDDQRALLRLLAQREEGYEDIAALMGIGVDEVRARVREAVAALDEGAPAAQGTHRLLR